MKAKPFLKWAGGKYRLLERILPELPAGARLVEPFAGSAAVYLNAPFKKALVCDVNRDLIGLFQILQAEGGSFIRRCQAHFTPDNNARDRYYALRDAFNASADPKERAALFLYLNRHSFNGLIRYNSRGIFNVPFGRYARPYFPLAELHAFLDRTRDTKTEFAVLNFRDVFSRLRPGDVVYCDPPYVPLSRTAKFTAYTGVSFTENDQRDLASLAAHAWKRGIPVILSNHDTEAVRSLYAAARLRRFAVNRSISCKGDRRSRAPELLAVFR